MDVTVTRKYRNKDFYKLDNTSVVLSESAKDMSASRILDALLSADGSGSGLDADLLDGQHGAYYAPVAGPTLTGVVTTGSHHRKTISVGASGIGGAQVNYLRLQPSNVANCVVVRLTIKGVWSNIALQGFLTGEYSAFAQADGNVSNNDFRITSTTGLVWNFARLSNIVAENGYYSIGIYITNSNPVELDVEWWDSSNIIKDNLTMSGWAGAALPAANFQSIQGDLVVSGKLLVYGS